MTVQCIRCQHFSLRDDKAMAKLGYGHCEFQPRRSHFDNATFPRHCSQFEPADVDTANARQSWLDREQKRFMREVIGNGEN